MLNVVALALFGAAWLEVGGLILAGDSTRQVLLIAAVFAYGLVRCAGKICTTSVELNELRAAFRRLVTGTKYLESIQGHDAQSRRSALRRSR